jgi:hypothetical protein
MVITVVPPKPRKKGEKAKAKPLDRLVPVTSRLIDGIMDYGTSVYLAIQERHVEAWAKTDGPPAYAGDLAYVRIREAIEEVIRTKVSDTTLARRFSRKLKTTYNGGVRRQVALWFMTDKQIKKIEDKAEADFAKSKFGKLREEAQAPFYYERWSSDVVTEARIAKLITKNAKYNAQIAPHPFINNTTTEASIRERARKINNSLIHKLRASLYALEDGSKVRKSEIEASFIDVAEATVKRIMGKDYVAPTESQVYPTLTNGRTRRR